MPNKEQSSQMDGLTRRGFLKGVGAGAVATGVVSSANQAQEAAAGEAQVVGPGEVPVTLTINGKQKRLRIEPRVTLLDAMRNRLDLTGPKKVCDRGTCGACTVLLDGDPVYACSMLAIEAQGRELTTVEGLGTPENMNKVQKAFVKHDAQQCGFCTPGFVVACSAVVANKANPDADDFKKGLGGNLCRCGTYAGMAEACAEAARS